MRHDDDEAPAAPVRRLLLIEDEPADVRLLREHLRDGGRAFDLTVARDLGEALALPDGPLFDMVLVDLDLPDSAGMETLRRCQERWPRSPHVVLSGGVDGRLAQEVVAAGAQDYLVKADINGRALCRAMEYAIERHASADEHRQLVRELEQARKLEAIGQLAAGIAHEINTPCQYVSDNTHFLSEAVGELVAALGRVRGYVDERRAAPPEELAELLEQADVEFLLEEIPKAVQKSLDGLSHITRIVRAMRDFSHPPTDDKTSTDLHGCLDTTVVVATNEWKYVAQVEKDYDPELPEVECLPGEMNQVFLNLVVNAAHAIGEALGPSPAVKGRITVRTRLVEGGWAEVRVEDTGCGIPAALRARVFEPFFTTKAVGKGTGQGLAIAYDVVVRKHGGKLSIESEEGRGTAVVVRLPVRAQPDEALAA